MIEHAADDKTGPWYRQRMGIFLSAFYLLAVVFALGSVDDRPWPEDE